MKRPGHDRPRPLGERRAECILAHPAALGRKVDPLRGIIQRHAVQQDPAPVGGFDSGDAFQRHAFSTAGGPEQAGYAAADGEIRFQGEAAQLLFDLYLQAHVFTRRF